MSQTECINTLLTKNVLLKKEAQIAYVMILDIGVIAQWVAISNCIYIVTHYIYINEAYMSLLSTAIVPGAEVNKLWQFAVCVIWSLYFLPSYENAKCQRPARCPR